MAARDAWLAVALAAVAAALGALQGLGNADLALSDLLRPQAPQASHDIVIVAIDEPSLERMGRWPWPRLRHAELLEQLMPLAPRAIGFDVLLTEASSPQEDAVLADVMRRSARVVLPVSSQPDGSLLAPLALYANAARALGRVDVVVDDDGLVRSVPFGGKPDHLAVAMAAIGGSGNPGSGAGNGTGLKPWQQSEPTLLDFHEPGQGFLQLSYADVVAGRFDAARLRNAYVLVGMTATGLGDQHATPALPSRGLRPGVDVLATALEAQLTGHAVRRAPAFWNAVANALVVLLACALLVRLPADRAWVVLIGTLVVFGGLVALLRSAAHVQVLPLAGALMLVVAYLAWSTRWLRKTLDYVFTEIGRLRADGTASDARDVPEIGDLAGGLALLQRQSDAMRNAKTVLEQTLDRLPDCTFVVDAERKVLLLNAAARAMFAQVYEPVGADVAQLWSQRLRRADTSGEHPDIRGLGELLVATPATQEVQDAAGSRFLLRCLPRAMPQGQPIGWIATLVDVRASPSRVGLGEEALGHLSHDMRAPQASILSLLELHRAGALQATQAELLDRIGRLAETTLGYADDFIHLARAESTAYDNSPQLLLDVAVEVADELWARARAAGVSITVDGDEAWCRGDRTLLHRAMQNLIDNAIKFAPQGTQIECAVRQAGDRVEFSVRDHGPGLGANPARLFEPFAQGAQGTKGSPGTSARTSGAGLGLALVRTVAQRHGGGAEAANATGGGARVAIWLPAVAAPADG